MSKVTKVKNHLSLVELKTMIRKSDNPDKRMRWQIVYTVAADPRDAATIALQLGCCKCLVSNAVREYNRLASKAFSGPGKGKSRSNFHLSYEEEVKFLSKFVNRARRGLVTTTGEIRRAFDMKIGKQVHASVISRLLKRHQWRKLEPHREHPKKNKQKQESFKKNFLAWFPPQ
jgi:transposase